MDWTNSLNCPTASKFYAQNKYQFLFWKHYIYELDSKFKHKQDAAFQILNLHKCCNFTIYSISTNSPPIYNTKNNIKNLNFGQNYVWLVHKIYY